MIRHTFRPHERIRLSRDFDRAFGLKKSVSDAHLIVYPSRNGLAHTRLGIVVSKKRIRSAVARNRIKRLIREAFRLSKQQLPPGLDLVVLPRGPRLTLALALESLPRLARDAARRLGPAVREQGLAP